MATAALISEKEYLATSYRPDCDFVDGVVEERNSGENEHSRLQGEILILLAAAVTPFGLRALPELRIRVAPGRYRIPDVCVIAASNRERVIVTPPLVCIEVLSPGDPLPRIGSRVRDYHAMGVPEVWVFDPESRTAWIWTPEAMREVREDKLTLPNDAGAISLREVFAVLD